MNLDKYRNERRTPRTEQVNVPQLTNYFEGGQPLFTVRGLSAAELGRCKEAAERQRNTAALARTLFGSDSTARAAALKELAVGPDVPDDVCQRIEMLALGCLEPQLEHGDAVLFSDDFPAEFYQLTSKIIELTGAGRVLGKPIASGKMAK